MKPNPQCRVLYWALGNRVLLSGTLIIINNDGTESFVPNARTVVAKLRRIGCVRYTADVV